MSAALLPCGLGVDAGGTATRWALAAPDGRTLGEGSVAGMHGRIASSDDRAHIELTLAELAHAVAVHGTPTHVVGGISGYDPRIMGEDTFLLTLARVLRLPVGCIALCDDILLSYLAALAPGDGYLVYAGTGSMSVYIDVSGALYRAGGRGIVMDDGGSGFWIAREALRRIWRQEEQAPGSWRQSALARRLFDAIGGSDWHATRQFVYARRRGEIGTLALQVAASADDDAAAREVLADAGRELARLARVQWQRHGPRPVVLAGGVFGLHPLIEQTMAQALGGSVPLRAQALQAHRKAASLAAQGAEGLDRLRRIHEGGVTHPL